MKLPVRAGWEASRFKVLVDNGEMKILSCAFNMLEKIDRMSFCLSHKPVPPAPPAPPSSD